MSRNVLHIVTEAEQGARLDAVLAQAGCYPSRSSAAKRIDQGVVFVDGVHQAKSYPVNAGESIVFEELEEKTHLPMVGEDIPLDIRYENQYLLVISKQAGLICHPSHNHSEQTLVNALIYLYGYDNLAHVQGDDRPGIVHRLDGDTSGLMLCAKDDKAGLALQEAIRLKTVDRRYIALVHGSVAHDTGEIDAPIARNQKTGVSMRVSNGPSSREALTSFRVLERFEAARKDDGFTLVECKLFTGRTHQIRVHMQYIHHCIVGDPTYGSFGPKEQLGLQRQFLHSYRLAFMHPVTQEPLSFTDYLPNDLAHALVRLSGRSMGRTPAGEEVLAAMTATRVALGR